MPEENWPMKLSAGWTGKDPELRNIISAMYPRTQSANNQHKRFFTAETTLMSTLKIR